MSDDQPIRLADVARVIDAFETSTWTELRLRAGGVVLHMSTRGEALGTVAPAASPQPAPAVVTTSAVVPGGPASRPETSGPETVGPETGLDGAGHTEEVLSPCVGVFWCAPGPGLPPFVEIGDEVEPGTTVGIVEVMKLMNHIKATTRGRVVSIAATNGSTVESGQVLLRLTPTEGA